MRGVKLDKGAAFLRKGCYHASSRGERKRERTGWNYARNSESRCGRSSTGPVINHTQLPRPLVNITSNSQPESIVFPRIEAGGYDAMLGSCLHDGKTRGQLLVIIALWGLPKNKKWITASLDLRPVAFRSRGKNMAEGNRGPGLYSRKYGNRLGRETCHLCSQNATAETKALKTRLSTHWKNTRTKLNKQSYNVRCSQTWT